MYSFIDVLKEIEDWNPMKHFVVDANKLSQHTRKIPYMEIRKSDWAGVRYLYVRSMFSPFVKKVEQGCYLSHDGTWALMNGEMPHRLQLAVTQCSEKLRVLDIWGENINEINLAHLRGLQVLDFTSCKDLKRVHGLPLLERLEFLNLNNTRVGPVLDVSTLRHLRELYLGENPNLRTVNGLDQLYDMRRLHLGETGVVEIPDGIQYMKRLEGLNLSGLDLIDIPDWITELGLEFETERRRAGIILENTTAEKVDMSIFDQSRETIVKWFEARKQGGDSPLNEIKVIFLGNGDVGKSHTIARLMRDGEKLDDSFKGDATPGIAIENKEYDISDQKIQVHFWDFGGQDILYSMHRMFLTERTIYVVMVDARNETRSSQAREWLDTIRSFAGSAPVLLAVNKTDQNPSASVDERGLMNAYPNLKKVVCMSALKADRQEFNEIFRDELLKLIRQSDVPKMQWPKTWRNVKLGLQNMTASYIDTAGYEAICRECGVTEKQENLLHWFKDLGVCFCHTEDYNLKDFVILKPEWITNAIYTILFNKREEVSNGMISRQEIDSLLNPTPEKRRKIRRVVTDASYKWQETNYVLDVVRKFYLSYAVDQQTEFFPMLCSENSSPVAKQYADAEDTLEFHMEFDYLPNNVLHRLMVQRWHDLDTGHVWLTGARFRQQGTGLSAVVRIDDNILKLYVRSEHALHSRNTYLSTMENAIDRIRRELKLPKPKNWLIYKAEDKRVPFDYEDLLTMLADGVETVYCTKLSRQNRNVRIMDILDQAAPSRTAEQEQLLADLVKISTQIQAEMLYRGTRENTRNTYYRNSLDNMGYIVRDQSLRGLADGGQVEGELDLDIRKYPNVTWTICEALRVSGGELVKWDNHLDKLLDKYNTNGLQFLVTLTYVDDEKDRFGEIWKSFMDHIRSHDTPKFQVVPNSFRHFTTEPWTGNEFIQTAKCRYACGDYTPTVYHIFVRMGR